MKPDKKLTVVFYRSATGAEPVRLWIKSMAPDDRQVLGRDLRLLELGWPVGMPLCRAFGSGLWEARSALPGNRIARILFCAMQGHMVLLHGFIKKTQKTPAAELDLARARQKEISRYLEVKR